MWLLSIAAIVFHMSYFQVSQTSLSVVNKHPKIVESRLIYVGRSGLCTCVLRCTPLVMQQNSVTLVPDHGSFHTNESKRPMDLLWTIWLGRNSVFPLAYCSAEMKRPISAAKVIAKRPITPVGNVKRDAWSKLQRQTDEVHSEHINLT